MRIRTWYERAPIHLRSLENSCHRKVYRSFVEFDAAFPQFPFLFGVYVLLIIVIIVAVFLRLVAIYPVAIFGNTLAAATWRG